MGNHFNLLLETPEPNLVAGMKWLLMTAGQSYGQIFYLSDFNRQSCYQPPVEQE